MDEVKLLIEDIDSRIEKARHVLLLTFDEDNDYKEAFCNGGLYELALFKHKLQEVLNSASSKRVSESPDPHGDLHDVGQSVGEAAGITEGSGEAVGRSLDNRSEEIKDCGMCDGLGKVYCGGPFGWVKCNLCNGKQS